MARTTKPLTDTEIKQAKPREREYSLADGGGLNLRIKPIGSKLWIFNYSRPYTKARANLGLGSYPDVSLREARDKAQLYRGLLARDVDPRDDRIEQERLHQESLANTFGNVTTRWLKLKKPRISTNYYQKITNRLDSYILPKLGKVPIHKVTAPLAISVINPLADRNKLETVKKICGWLNEIMVYGVNAGLIYANPLSGISKVFVSPKTTGLPALPPEELPELMFKLSHSSTKLVTRCLIEWQLHTMVRPSEAVGTRWDEIDFENKLWTIPAERMKQKRFHNIPLSPQAIKILEHLKPITGSREFVFPSDFNPRKSANSQTANRALARMGFHGRLVSHGLRSMASTILNNNGFDKDIVEFALSHVGSDGVRRAYFRGDYLEIRTTMMSWWSDHIENASKC